MRALALAAALAALAPSTARADDVMRLLERLGVDEGDRELGLLTTPVFGASLAFMAVQAVESSRSHWFDRSWAIAELAAGLAGTAYSTVLLHGAIEDERGQAIPISSWTAGAALALNLRLVTHAALSYLLFDGGEDPLVRSLVPSISVSPREGGAVVSVGWIY
jgi:hypothetical protein